MDLRRRPQTETGPLMEPKALVRKSTIVYGIMTLVGAAVLQFGHKHLPRSFAIPSDPYEIFRLVAIGVLGASLLLVLSYFFEDWFPSFRELKSVIMRFLGPVTVPMALYLAVVTSVGEELLFRGAIQPFAGLVLTSVLFGLLHMGQDGLVSAWSVWAFIAGLLLGWMYEETHSLWPPIIAHFGVNAISILNLRRSYRGYAQRVEGAANGDGPTPKAD
jgi:membrane protease YdiL (CAAX protease family)